MQYGADGASSNYTQRRVVRSCYSATTMPMTSLMYPGPVPAPGTGPGEAGAHLQSWRPPSAGCRVAGEGQGAGASAAGSTPRQGGSPLGQCSHRELIVNTNSY